jgi:streptogramin lyase
MSDTLVAPKVSDERFASRAATFADITLPDGVVAGAMAMGPPPYEAWITDKAPRAAGVSGLVFHLDEDGTVLPDTCTIPPTVNANFKAMRLGGIALQTNASDVQRVWVADEDGRAIYAFNPGDTTATQIDPAFFNNFARPPRPRAIAFDKDLRRVWFADYYGPNICFVDVATNSIFPYVVVGQGGAGISKMIYSQGYLWVASHDSNIYRISTTNQNDRQVYYIPGPTVPTSIAFDAAQRRLWVVTSGTTLNELRLLSNLTNPDAPMHVVHEFVGDVNPYDVTVDQYNFIWVSCRTRYANHGRSIFEFSPLGAPLSETVIPNLTPIITAEPSVLIHRNPNSSRDELWISDLSSQAHRVVRMTPNDHYIPGSKNLKINPGYRFVKPNTSLGLVVFQVVDDQNQGVVGQIVNLTCAGQPLEFRNGSQVSSFSQVTTEIGGYASVNNLYSKGLAGTLDPTPFTVTGVLRSGRPFAQPAILGGITNNTSALQLVPDPPVPVAYARVGQEFRQHPRVRAIQPPDTGVPGRTVSFEIIAGSGHFVDDSGVLSNPYPKRTDPTGHAEIRVVGDAVGKLAIRVSTDGTTPVDFNWEVTPIPTVVLFDRPRIEVLEGDYYGDDGADPLVATVMSDATPCPGEAVTFVMGDALAGGQLVDHNNVPFPSLVIETNADGSVSCGAGQDFGLLGARPDPEGHNLLATVDVSGVAPGSTKVVVVSK